MDKNGYYDEKRSRLTIAVEPVIHFILAMIYHEETVVT